MNAQVLPGTGVHDVKAAVGEPPLRFYRRVYTLRFACSGADSIEIAPEGVRLGAAFRKLDYDARAEAPPLRAAVTAGAVVIAQLDGPRDVRRIKLPDAKGVSGATVELLRMDGSKPATEPTTSASAATSAAAFTTFRDSRFGIRYRTGTGPGALAPSDVVELGVRSHPTLPRLSLAAPDRLDDGAPFWAAPGEHTSEVAVAAHGELAAALAAYLGALPAPLPAIIDVALVAASDAPCVFAPSEIAVPYRLVIRSFSWPLVAEADLLDPDALAAELRAPRSPVAAQVRAGFPAGALAAAAGPEPAAALVAGLNSVLTGGPVYDAGIWAGAALDPELRAAAEAGAAGPELVRLNRALLEQGLPRMVATRSSKRVLRFGPDRRVPATVSVTLPPAAAVTTATISGVESLAAARPPSEEAAGGPAVDGVPIERELGWRIIPGRWTAASVAAPDPVVIGGVAIALMSTAPGTVVAVELHPDRRGRPSGLALASGEAAAGPAGSARWVHIRFPTAITLQPPTHWIAVTAAAGEGVWLARPDAGSGVVFGRAAEAGDWAVAGALEGHALAAELLAVGGPARSAPGAAASAGGAAVASELRPDGTRVWDLSAALSAHAAAAPAGGPVAVALSSALRGSISLDPPEIVYELS